MGSAVASSGGVGTQASATLCPTSQKDEREGEISLLEHWKVRADALFAPAALQPAGQDAAKLRTIREDEEEEQEPASALQTVMSSVPTLYDSVTTVFGTAASEATVYGTGGSRMASRASSSASRKEADPDDAGRSPLASMVSSSVFSSFGSAAAADPFATIAGTGRRRRPAGSVAGSEPRAGAGQEAGVMNPLMSALSSTFSSSSPAPAASGAPSAAGSGAGPLGSQQSVAGSMFSNLGGGLFSSKTTKAQALTQQQGAFFVQEATPEVVETEDRQLACCHACAA